MNEIKKIEAREIALPDLSLLKNDENFQAIALAMPEHAGMLENIAKALPELHRAASNFYKTQSQFMDNMMTVSHWTPLHNLRQILAQVTNMRQAITENTLKLKKKEIERRVLVKKLENKDLTAEEIDAIQLDIIEIDTAEETARRYISGAIRILDNYAAQYQNITKNHGINEFSEKDFEEEEAIYHIAKAFDQATCAARSRGGIVDEGNMIYFGNIGINPGAAQRQIQAYLAMEENLYKGLDEKGEPLRDKQGNPVGPSEPTHRMYIMFLERMASRYKGHAKEFAEWKGMTTQTESALIQHGDRRLLDAPKL